MTLAPALSTPPAAHPRDATQAAPTDPEHLCLVNGFTHKGIL